MLASILESGTEPESSHWEEVALDAADCRQPVHKVYTGACLALAEICEMSGREARLFLDKDEDEDVIEAGDPRARTVVETVSELYVEEPGLSLQTYVDRAVDEIDDPWFHDYPGVETTRHGNVRFDDPGTAEEVFNRISQEKGYSTREQGERTWAYWESLPFTPGVSMIYLEDETVGSVRSLGLKRHVREELEP